LGRNFSKKSVLSPVNRKFGYEVKEFPINLQKTEKQITKTTCESQKVLEKRKCTQRSRRNQAFITLKMAQIQLFENKWNPSAKNKRITEKRKYQSRCDGAKIMVMLKKEMQESTIKLGAC
jgi:hypothetical protein